MILYLLDDRIGNFSGEVGGVAVLVLFLRFFLLVWVRLLGIPFYAGFGLDGSLKVFPFTGFKRLAGVDETL